jgi:osmoprotectant transport system permease protein
MIAAFTTEVIEWFTDPSHWSGSFGILARTLEHLIMSGVSLGIGAAIALPAGMYIGHTRRFEFIAVTVANLGRSIPSFGLLFLFVLWLGIGLGSPPSLRPPVIFALVLLAIPPILTNTYVGIQSVNAGTLEAARGMGMSDGHVLSRIEIPLGVPLILAGLRTAAVQVVATATLGAVVGGGGLGRFIIDGFATGNDPQIFGGALLVALLAIVTELGFGLLERVATPRTSSRGRARAEPLPAELAEAAQPGGPVV